MPIYYARKVHFGANASDDRFEQATSFSFVVTVSVIPIFATSRASVDHRSSPGRLVLAGAVTWRPWLITEKSGEEFRRAGDVENDEDEVQQMTLLPPIAKESKQAKQRWISALFHSGVTL